MKTLKYIPFLLLLLTGCTKEIPLDLNNDEFQRLVVEAWLTDEAKAHEVKLTLTADYFKNEAPEPAKGAIVSISDGSNIYELTETEDGRYFTNEDVAGEAGKTYTLHIDYDGKKYEATSMLEAAPPIDTLEAIEEEDLDEDDEFNEYTILLHTTEPEGLGDHYYWRSYPVDLPNDPTRTFWEIAEDQFVDGNLIGGAEILYVEAKPSETFVFEQYRITEEAFDFLLAIQFETIYKGGLYDSPPANIPSNVNNGAVGFFITAGVERSTVSFE